MKDLSVLATSLIAAFVLFLKAQFGFNIVPEFNDFMAVLILFVVAVVGIWRNNRKKK